jgi:hypothetical protein
VGGEHLLVGRTSQCVVVKARTKGHYLPDTLRNTFAVSRQHRHSGTVIRILFNLAATKYLYYKSLTRYTEIMGFAAVVENQMTVTDRAIALFLRRLLLRSNLDAREQAAIRALKAVVVTVSARRDFVRPGQSVEHVSLVAGSGRRGGAL